MCNQGRGIALAPFDELKQEAEWIVCYNNTYESVINYTKRGGRRLAKVVVLFFVFCFYFLRRSEGGRPNEIENTQSF